MPNYLQRFFGAASAFGTFGFVDSQRILREELKAADAQPASPVLYTKCLIHYLLAGANTYKFEDRSFFSEGLWRVMPEGSKRRQTDGLDLSQVRQGPIRILVHDGVDLELPRHNKDRVVVRFRDDGASSFFMDGKAIIYQDLQYVLPELGYPRAASVLSDWARVAFLSRKDGWCLHSNNLAALQGRFVEHLRDENHAIKHDHQKQQLAAEPA